jgi:hypothetical protein
MTYHGTGRATVVERTVFLVRCERCGTAQGSHGSEGATVNVMVQPPDYYILMAMQAQPRRYHPDIPVGPARTSLRDRIRTLLTRTTLGPVAGDHVLGEGQWWTLQGCDPVR